MAALLGTAITPSLTNWDFNVYKRGFEAATYQDMKLIPVVDEAMRLYNQLTIRKATRLTAATLATTSDGTDLDYQSPVGVPVSLTPVHSVVPISYGDNQQAQTDFNITREMGAQITAALAEATESTVMANFQTATQFLSDADVSATMLRQAGARLFGNTNGNFGPGTSTPFYGFFSHTQLPNLQAIPEVNSAEMRGDAENPYVRGIWVKGFGFVLNISTVIPQDGNGWHNALLVASGLVTSWNQRSTIEEGKIELGNYAIAHNNMGSNILHDARLLIMRTTNDAS